MVPNCVIANFLSHPSKEIELGPFNLLASLQTNRKARLDCTVKLDENTGILNGSFRTDIARMVCLHKNATSHC